MAHPAHWLHDPAETGVHIATDSGGWDFVRYPDLAAQARRMATRLIRLGVGREDVVCLVLPSDRELIAGIYGVWAAGATICPVTPPLFAGNDSYIGHIAGILAQAAPPVVVTVDAYEPLVVAALERAGVAAAVWVVDDVAGQEPAPIAEPASIALLQFTSGSTGTPRGVRVSFDNLIANFGAFDYFARGEAADGVASWLPIHHDMGLIGCLLFPVAHQQNLWIMRPDQFIRDPARWLECLTPGKARHAGCPPFGLAYAARKITPARLAELDLSNVHSVVIGAESVDPAVLQRFVEFAAPAGFSGDTLRPAYGLAENTVAVAINRHGDRISLVRLDRPAVVFGRPAPILDTATFGTVAAAAGDGWLVGHGLPEPGTGIGVRIVDESGQELPPGFVGEIAVTGTSVAHGYHGVTGDCTTFAGDRLLTGDAGFIHGGDLYVLGRMGDSIKINGRSVYAEDLDALLAAATGIEAGRLATVATTESGRPAVVVFAVAKPGPWAEAARTALRTEFGRGVEITVVCGGPRLILRTSSGKPRRKNMWMALRTGDMSGTIIPETGTDSAAAHPEQKEVAR
ncbi:MAG: AMP-binding protein [Nocardia sp.]|nr:AMP-binding protein [Nocardia sp.]